MDFHKLKLEKYQRVAVAGLPDGVELPFAPTEGTFDCLLAFVQSEDALKDAVETAVAAGTGTGLVIAYPKGSSKKYQSTVNRDSIISHIQAVGGFKAPRLVSLDKDWSGFSFRYEGESR
jgi:hypothetical protein